MLTLDVCVSNFHYLLTLPLDHKSPLTLFGLKLHSLALSPVNNAVQSIATVLQKVPFDGFIMCLNPLSFNKLLFKEDKTILPPFYLNEAKNPIAQQIITL